MFCFLQVFCSLFSGLLLSAAIPNEFLKLGNPLLAIVSLVPLYIAIRRARSFKGAFWCCFLHGGFTHLLSSFWLGNFQGFAAFTLGASLVGTAFIEGFTGLFIYLPFSKTHLTQNSNDGFLVPLRIFWFSAVYLVYEWCKSTGFLAYPWGTLSMTMYRWPLIMQIADITGPYGVSFLLALINATISEGLLEFNSVIKKTDKTDRGTSYIQVFKAVACLTLAILCYGTYQTAKERTPVKYMNTVMVQQNLDTYNSNENEGIRISQHLTEEGIKELKNQDLSTDLVVWSEGVLGKNFPRAENYYDKFPRPVPLTAFIKKQKVPFIIGGSKAIDEEKHQYGNAALLFNRFGKLEGSYIKLHLVPFAEAIPFVEYPAVRKLVKKIAGFSYGWTSGKKYTLFEVPVSELDAVDTEAVEVISLTSSKIKKKPTVMVSSPICFDDAFSHVCRGLFLSGSEVFMNITNDSWSKKESSEYQHFVVSSYRAIEYRTTLARCTNSGYSVVVGPDGKILQDCPLFVESYVAARIPVYQRVMTTYARFGDWVAYLSLLFLFVFAIYEFNYEKTHAVTEISTELVKTRRRTTSSTRRPKTSK
ncbi:MAG: apolipoprotein N-acyltransferase [Treponema sp.]|nr:apolipoprotein N-acyltransferase [Treponema sp.]